MSLTLSSAVVTEMETKEATSATPLNTRSIDDNDAPAVRHPTLAPVALSTTRLFLFS